MTKTTTRRGFLGLMTALLGSIPLLGGLWVAIKVGLTPAHSTRPTRFPLCRVDEIPDDDILTRTVSFQMRRGPLVEDVSRIVFVTKDPGNPPAILALSGECSHLACPVQKREIEKGVAGVLHCPCHGGVFSRTGEVLDGPPPAPLRRLPIQLPEDGQGMIFLDEV